MKFEWLAGYHNCVVGQIIAEFTKGERSSEAFWEEFERDPLPLLEAMIENSDGMRRERPR